jgi:amidase
MEELEIIDIHRKYQSGELTVEKLVQQFIERIQIVDKDILNSVAIINPDALDIARELDREIKEIGVSKPLHGIPILIKENIDTSDKMVTSAGSLALKDHIAKNDSHVVKLMREAGAIILGKSNLSEWANFRGQRSTSGWSSKNGQTNNPYDTRRNPCGSSSGSAVAVAANLCTASIGTETDGSIVCPAHTNGVVGIKPSIGLVSRSGIIPISETQDTAGPMARTVKDAAILLASIIGYDVKDPITVKAKEFTLNLNNCFNTNDFQGLRFGILRNYSNFSPKVMKLFEENVNKIKAHGADVIDPIEIKLPENIGSSEYTVLTYEYKDGLNKYFKSLDEGIGIKTIEDVIAFNQMHENTILEHFGQEHFTAAQLKGDLETEEYKLALEVYDKLKENIRRVMNENNLDVIIVPTGGPAWMTDHVNGDNYSGGSSSILAAVTGFCNITVPMGYIAGLPVGLSFISTDLQEEKIIKAAYAFEQLIKVRISPIIK